MKPSTRLTTITITLTVFALLGLRAHAGDYTVPPLDKAVPTRLDLAPGFKPAADAPKRDLGIRRMSGVAVEPRPGFHAIFISEALSAVLAGNPLLGGDLVLAVDGKPLGQDPAADFRNAVRKKNTGSGLIWVTRWRAGEIQTVMVDLGTKPLDLTRGAPHNPDALEWNLGATGAFGWTWSVPHRTTAGATQIYITRVEPGHPADGKLKPGDVILGAFGKPFTKDARKEFGSALAIAETEAKNGGLALMVWRQGKRGEVTVPMRVLGTYSTTSPFDCPKSDRIIDMAAASIMEHGGIKEGIVGNINSLAMLATGRPEYLPAIRKSAHAVAAKGRDLKFDLARESWHWSYANIFLTEYYLATGDETVLPAIREYAVKTARGQSRVGTWGHSMCLPMQMPDGPRYGIAPGYGALNCTGLPCMISLILARECGVDDPEVDAAIQRGADFLRFFVDKGSIPYGDHVPGTGDHEDNGKNSMAAVMFDLLGDREAAAFFTKMTVASFDDREFGHTGNFFSFLWGALGAARGGTDSLAVFMNELRWFYDLERRWNGNFLYQGKPGMGRNPGGEHQYVGWDCTGARLLHYGIPLAQLRITGRGRGFVPKLTGAELEDVAAAGRLAEGGYAALSTDQLLEKLASWSPIVRRRAAIALQAKPDNPTARLIAMLDSDNRYARYGACEGLRHAGRASADAADAIVAKGLASADATLRYYAMHAFTHTDERMGLSAVAHRAIPTLFRMAAAEPPVGPRDRQTLGEVLFSNRGDNSSRAIFRNGEGIETLDRELLIPAVRALLKENNGWIRSSVSAIYPRLTPADLDLLWGDIKSASDELAPSGIMFASPVRVNGIRLMAEHRTRAGLESAINYLRHQKGHGSEQRLKDVLEIIIEHYGGHAKAYLGKLEEYAAFFEAGEPNFPLPNSKRKAADVREAIRTIQSMPAPTEPLIEIPALDGR